MVRPKNPPKKNTWQDLMKRIDEEHPIIDTRYYVVEITPAYNTGGYYDQDIPEKVIRVSDYFQTAAEATNWLNDHEPDEGKTLETRKQHKRRTIIEKWW